MQTVAVTDANIFIDLIKTDTIHLLFKLELRIHTTQEVVDELEPYQQDVVYALSKEGDVSIYGLSYEELSNMPNQKFPDGLHLDDQTVFVLAKKIDGILLSGDKKLRKYCERNDILVKGILWIYDEAYERNLMDTIVLVERIKLLMSINKRLPINDCQERIARWQGNL
jgi:predicted nucleic acid-binding protein